MRKVDHDNRREEVASVASRLIADKGLEALTTRALAKELGCSIGVLSHYFNSKEEIVLAAFQWADQRIDQRMQAAASDQDTSLDYFIPMIQAGLPLDEDSDREWRVRLNLYNYCLTRNGEGLSTQIEKNNHFRELMQSLIKDLQIKGEVRNDISAEQLTRVAFDLVMGAAQNLLMMPIEERQQHASYLFDLVEQMRAKKQAPARLAEA